LSAPPSTPQLRPLSVGEMLDAGFRLMRQRFGTLMLCTVIPVLPLSILGTIIIASVSENAFDRTATTTTDDAGGLLAAFFVTVLLQGAGLALAVAACFKAVAAAYLGERSGVGESLRYALRRLIPVVVAYLVLTFLVGIGLILLIVPGVFLGVRWAMTLPAVVFERKGPFSAMGRAWELTGDNFWRVFATLLLVSLLVFVISFAVQGVLEAALFAVDDSSEFVVATISTLAQVIGIALTYPLLAAVFAVIYYDLRVRKEGFDLQLLAHAVGADEARFAAAPERPVTPLAPAEPPQGEGGGFTPPRGPSTAA
jgi:hypothetical protein